jgi:hypothetical protein
VDTEERKSKATEKAGKTTISEKERHRDKAQNKARAATGRARSKKAGHEAVSDQKSHEYH